MSRIHSQAVMDVYPWPRGLGFKEASTWWEYVGSQTENEKLDLLMTTALLSEEVCRLLLSHDRTLLNAFQFSDQTIALLSNIEATTLSAFMEAFLLEANGALSKQP